MSGGAALAAEVAAAIREAGQATGAGPLIATLIRQVAPPATPWDEPGSSSTHQVAVLVERFDQRLIDGTMIRADDRRVMMEAVGPEPRTGDRLTIGAVTYSVLSVQQEAPGGLPLYYLLHCRR